MIYARDVLSSARFYQSPWGYFWIPALRAYPGPAALHYPGYYLALPALTARLDLILTAFLGSFLAGWGALLFRQSYLMRHDPPRVSLRRAASRYGALLAIAAQLFVRPQLEVDCNRGADGQERGCDLSVGQHGPFQRPTSALGTARERPAC